MNLRAVACAIAVAVLAGCDDESGGTSFEGTWLRVAELPGGGTFGPDAPLFLNEIGDTVMIYGSSFARSGDSFAGWDAGGEAIGTYVTGIYAGGVLTITVDTWSGGAIVDTYDETYVRSELPADGTLDAAYDSFELSYTGAVAFQDPVDCSITIMQSGVAKHLRVYIAGSITATGVYDVGSDISHVDFQNEFGADTAPWGTVTITELTADRITGTFALDTYSMASLDGSFDVPLGVSTPVPADECEDDDAKTTAKPIAVNGQPARHTFHDTGDTDWISVGLDSAPLTVAFETAGLGAATDTYLVLYATNGTTVLASNDDGGSQERASMITYTFTAPGTYYLRVTDYNYARGYYSVEARTAP